MKPSAIAASLALLLLPATSSPGSPQTPQPVGDASFAPYSLSGIIGTYESWGSGVAAAHPNVVLSCAHVVFGLDAFSWTSGARWHRAWNKAAEPTDAEGLALDGYYYWSSYASAARNTFTSYSAFKEAREFNQDFVAYYRAASPVAGGSFALAWTNGAMPLASSNTAKLVTGYPMGRYGEQDPLRYRMHETAVNAGLRPEYRQLANYLVIYDVAETGSGNSGGPVWTADSGGQQRVAGILVSGQETTLADAGSNWDRSMVGIHAISSAGWRLINAAMQASGKTPLVKSFSPGQGAATVVDGRSLSRTFKVSGMPSFATDITVDLDLTTADPEDRRDYYVTLRSPGGRTVVVYDGRWDGQGPDDPTFTFPLDDEPTVYFYAVNPNGVWTLAIRDRKKNGVAGNFISASLNITCAR